jgi:ElaB/YqjD/DUF883 family membrane-anchored ribosome-binding protein
MADDALAKELETLKADIGKLRADVADLTRAVKGVASGKVDDANARVHDEIRQAREELRRKVNEARDYGEKRVGDFAGQIGEHPLGSVLAAFGIGFVIAKLMGLGGRR